MTILSLINILLCLYILLVSLLMLVKYIFKLNNKFFNWLTDHVEFLAIFLTMFVGM